MHGSVRGLVTAILWRGHGIISHLIFAQKAIHQQAKQTSTLYRIYPQEEARRQHNHILAYLWMQRANDSELRKAISYDMAAQLAPSSHCLPLAAKIFSTAVGSKPFAPRPYLNSGPSCKLGQRHLSWAPDTSVASWPCLVFGIQWYSHYKSMWQLAEPMIALQQCHNHQTSRVHTKTYAPKRIWIETCSYSNMLRVNALSRKRRLPARHGQPFRNLPCWFFNSTIYMYIFWVWHWHWVPPTLSLSGRPPSALCANGAPSARSVHPHEALASENWQPINSEKGWIR